MSKYVINNGDGTVGILVPAPSSKLSIEEILAKDVPEGKSYREISDNDLPSDRTFRNAWTDDQPGNKVDVDMPRARDIHMDRLRIDRDEKLKEKDLEFILALEQGADTAAIVAEKQELRDMPQTFDLSVFNTPQALANARPPYLD